MTVVESYSCTFKRKWYRYPTQKDGYKTVTTIKETWARILKLLRTPGIDSTESIPSEK